MDARDARQQRLAFDERKGARQGLREDGVEHVNDGIQLQPAHADRVVLDGMIDAATLRTSR